MQKKKAIHSQRGAVASELAVSMIFFIALILAVVEMSRVMYMFNAASEATRLGARLAAVCDDDASVKNAVNSNILPLGVAYYKIDRSGNVVTFSISGASINPLAPFFPTIPVPSFPTTMTTESMKCQ